MTSYSEEEEGGMLLADVKGQGGVGVWRPAGTDQGQGQRMRRR